MPSETININWKDLIEAVNNQACILVLGPHIATIDYDGKNTPVPQVLAKHLAKKLLEIRPNAELINSFDLAYVAKQLEDAYMYQSNFRQGKARDELEKVICEFYTQFDHTKFPVFEQLAKLPFRFIVNTSPDNYLMDAFDDVNKFASINEYYHYKNPSHNNLVKIKDEEITTDAPLVYNLFGSLDNPESIIRVC